MSNSDRDAVSASDERSAQILREALKLFLEKGFHGTSTREICRRAGISSGLIFHYFPTKEAVYERLVELAFDAVPVGGGPDLPADPLAHLTAAVDGILTMLREDPRRAAMFVFMAHAQRNPGISATVDALFAERDLIVAAVPVVQAGQRIGQFRPGPPLALALALFAAIQGLAEELAVHPDYPVPPTEWYLDLVRASGGAS